jgi:uncharacterized protein (DUF1330 family)
MSAYLISNYDVVDADLYRSYQGKAMPIMAGGRLLVFDTSSVGKEGSPGAQTVVIEYATKEAALAAYQSDEYQEVVGIRLSATTNGRAVIVDGFSPPTG